MNYISKENLFAWLDAMTTDYQVHVPVKRGTHRFYKRYSSAVENIVIGEVRTTEPLKGFFTPAREKVAELFNLEVPAATQKPIAIVGVKACDLQGFVIQDHVFLNHSCQDPLYARAREDHLIIAADCTLALPTCFCLALDLRPYPVAHFDINLSEVQGGFVVEVGSLKGQHILDSHRSLFQEADSTHLKQRMARREQITSEVQRMIDACGLPHQEHYEGVIARNYEASVWQEEAKRCVECGACNTICPTCHCFVLTDQTAGETCARFRHWDSCMLKDFGRVASGGNPRPQLWMRLRNRFEKKFDFFPQLANCYACTGCGRCISACPAKIDIRQVLKRLVEDDELAQSVQPNQD